MEKMNVVIAGSAALQKEITSWRDYWEEKGFTVVNYPKAIPKKDFDSIYLDVHKKFFGDIMDADIFFVANEEKNNIVGYIGAETFAELSFAVMQNLLSGKNIRVILATIPSQEVACYSEIILWLRLGWIHDVINK